MKIWQEKGLTGFEFWAGAVDRVEVLTKEEVETLEAMLEDLYPDGIGETELNNIFWFDEDWLAECLGFEDWEELENSRR